MGCPPAGRIPDLRRRRVGIETAPSQTGGHALEEIQSDETANTPPDSAQPGRGKTPFDALTVLPVAGCARVDDVLGSPQRHRDRSAGRCSVRTVEGRHQRSGLRGADATLVCQLHRVSLRKSFQAAVVGEEFACEIERARFGGTIPKYEGDQLATGEGFGPTGEEPLSRPFVWRHAAKMTDMLNLLGGHGTDRVEHLSASRQVPATDHVSGWWGEWPESDLAVNCVHL